MFFVETCGLPGSGKSTFIRHLEKRHKCVAVSTLIAQLNKGTKFPPAVKRSDFRQNLYQLGRYRARYPEFVAEMDALSNENLVDWVLLNEIGVGHYFVQNHARGDEIATTDEGFVNRICAAFARNAYNTEDDHALPISQFVNFKRFQKIIEHMPLPDALVYVNVPEALALERYVDRLVSRRIKKGVIKAEKREDGARAVQKRLGGIAYLRIQSQYFDLAVLRLTERSVSVFKLTPETADVANMDKLTDQIATLAQ